MSAVYVFVCFSDRTSVVLIGCAQTYQWMAPEVITSKRYDESSDIYSFGIMLWELVSRDVPYADVQARTLYFCLLLQTSIADTVCLSPCRAVRR